MTDSGEGLLGNNIFTVSLKNDEEMEKYLTENNPSASWDEKEDQLYNSENPPNVQGNENTYSNSNSRRSLKERLFGKLDAGSVRGSIFNLAILSLGSGCLALPKKFGQMSVLVSIIDIIVAGFAAYWTLNIMIIASEKFKIYNYSQLVRTVYGKGLSILLDFTMLIYIFGVMILYQLIAYKLIGGVVNEFGGFGYKSIDDFFQNSFWSKNYIKFPVMYGIAFLIITPLCLLKNISKMRFNSIFGIFSLFFLILIIIIQTPWYFNDYLTHIYKKDVPETHLNLYDVSKGFTDELYFFKGTATLFYAYSCHVGAFPIYAELKNNVLRRVQKVFARSILLDAAFYMVVGVTGYLSNPIGTPDLIIERYKIFHNDWIMTIGWMAFIFTLMMKIPANYNSFRLTLITILGYKGLDIPNKINLIITIPTIAAACTIAALYSQIDDYISLMGSFCAVIIAFLIPGLLYIKANELPLTDKKNIFTIVIVTILCGIGLTSGIITIIGMIK